MKKYISQITILIISILLCVAIKAHAQLNIVITEGVDNATPIAVVPFGWEGEGILPGELSDVINHDLRRSGL